MKNALQDQLLKAGLADEKKLKSFNKEKHRQKKQAGKKYRPTNETAAQVEQQRQEKIARDRELNRQRQAALAEKEIAAQVRQLVETNRVPHQGEVAFNFADGSVVKRLHVNQKIHGELTRGQLAIARHGESYALIPAAVAEKIQERRPEAIVLRNDRDSGKDEPDADDPYADYQIPDDLMW